MQTINVSALADSAHDVHAALAQKVIMILGTTSAAGYLTAYSTNVSTAASAVPQVINFIGTHGPLLGFSWADTIAVMSGLLVLMNLLLAGHKIASGIMQKLRAIKAHFKKPRRRKKREDR